MVNDSTKIVDLCSPVYYSNDDKLNVVASFLLTEPFPFWSPITYSNDFLVNVGGVTIKLNTQPK